MANGFIYEIFDKIVTGLNYLNIVELFKVIAKRLTKEQRTEAIIASCNIAIDIFMVIKWALIAIFWINNLDGVPFSLVTGYLIFTNLHTYFYYHIWEERAICEQSISIARTRRRFLSLLLAVAFSIFCYAYLYDVPFTQYFAWPNDINRTLAVMYFSLANSFTGQGILVPNTNTGVVLAGSQFLSTFIFIAVILSRSLPQIKNTAGKGD